MLHASNIYNEYIFCFLGNIYRLQLFVLSVFRKNKSLKHIFYFVIKFSTKPVRITILSRQYICCEQEKTRKREINTNQKRNLITKKKKTRRNEVDQIKILHDQCVEMMLQYFHHMPMVFQMSQYTHIDSVLVRQRVYVQFRIVM